MNSKTAKALRARLKIELGVDHRDVQYQVLTHNNVLRQAYRTTPDGTYQLVEWNSRQYRLHPKCGRSIYKKAKRLLQTELQERLHVQAQR